MQNFLWRGISRLIVRSNTLRESWPKDLIFACGLGCAEIWCANSYNFSFLFKTNVGHHILRNLKIFQIFFVYFQFPLTRVWSDVWLKQSWSFWTIQKNLKAYNTLFSLSLLNIKTSYPIKHESIIFFCIYFFFKPNKKNPYKTLNYFFFYL